jgi:hypothetical protein
VRTRIAPEDWVLDETRNPRGKVGKAAERFRGALRSFASGSLAHRTVNNPISDGDAARRAQPRRVVPARARRRPRGTGRGHARARPVVCDELRGEYPRVSFELTKRAILFEFHEPMDDEDPSVDLVVCLRRRDEPGFWTRTATATAGTPPTRRPTPAAPANSDGTTTITIGPERPSDSPEGSWIQTSDGKGWFLILRLYSPLASFFDKSWRPSEIEPVTQGSNGHDPQTGR